MKKFTDKKKAGIIFLTAVAVVLLDQITKFFAEKYLTITYNPGAGFGLFQDSTSLLIWFSIIVIGIILYSYDKIPKQSSIQFYVGLLLGGTIGNLIDRIRLNYVIDFIDLKIWPSFNIADAAITISVIGLIIYLIKKK